MEKKLLIHIGLRKSGTTFLQKTILQEFSDSVSGCELFTFLVTGSSVERKNRDKAMVAMSRNIAEIDSSHRHQLNLLIEQAKGHRLTIISNEMLFDRFNVDESIKRIMSFAEWFKNREITLLITLRDQSSLVDSEYRHAVKFGLTTETKENWMSSSSPSDFEYLIEALENTGYRLIVSNVQDMKTQDWNELLSVFSTQEFELSNRNLQDKHNVGLGSRTINFALEINRLASKILTLTNYDGLALGSRGNLSRIRRLKQYFFTAVVVLKRSVIDTFDRLPPNDLPRKQIDTSNVWFVKLAKKRKKDPSKPWFLVG